MSCGVHKVTPEGCSWYSVGKSKFVVTLQKGQDQNNRSSAQLHHPIAITTVTMMEDQQKVSWRTYTWTDAQTDGWLIYYQVPNRHTLGDKKTTDLNLFDTVSSHVNVRWGQVVYCTCTCIIINKLYGQMYRHTPAWGHHKMTRNLMSLII